MHFIINVNWVRRGLDPTRMMPSAFCASKTRTKDPCSAQWKHKSLMASKLSIGSEHGSWTLIHHSRFALASALKLILDGLQAEFGGKYYIKVVGN